MAISGVGSPEFSQLLRTSTELLIPIRLLPFGQFPWVRSGLTGGWPSPWIRLNYGVPRSSRILRRAGTINVGDGATVMSTYLKGTPSDCVANHATAGPRLPERRIIIVQR